MDNFRLTPWASFSLSPFYEIAYRPALSPEGSCHKIKIEVDSKDESGHRMTVTEAGPIQAGGTFYTLKSEADRRNLVIYYRTQYCKVIHSAINPLYGTPASEKLKSAAKSDKTEAKGLSLSAVEFHDESNTSRVRVAFDFPHLSDQTGFPRFQIALLGKFTRTNGDLADRFSDNEEAGCPIEDRSDVDMRLLCGRSGFANHYETEVDLSPGDYDLQVAIDFGGAIRRAEVPVRVRALDKTLAVSGIALCVRYFSPISPCKGHSRLQTGYRHCLLN